MKNNNRLVLWVVLTVLILGCAMDKKSGALKADGKKMNENKEKTPAQSAVKNSEANSVEERAEKILKQMTLEEKCDYIGGKRPAQLDIRAVERLGIPAIKMSDGPMGVRSWGKSTYYPAGIGLAATWNPKLGEAFGKAIAKDCRARGVHILLAPGMNIYRMPQCGRNFEYLGEDPYLASRMVVPAIKGVQSEGVMAVAKHYACNNQEYGRKYISSDVDERTLREIYLPAFQASVTEGKAACVMNAYNPVNGYWSTDNNHLNNEILKGEWGFDGILMSDWVSTHGSASAANAGLDLEMPWGDYLNSEKLIPEIKAGKVTEKTIDDKVRRILRKIIEFGFLDREQKIESLPLDNPETAKVALDMARESVVLLKNSKSVLPLKKDEIRSISVFGENAHPDVPKGGGSSNTKTFHSVSIFEGIKEAAGSKVNVIFEAGSNIPGKETLFTKSEYLCADANGKMQNGLKAEYFAGIELSGEPVKTDFVSEINFKWGKKSPASEVPADKFSARYTGIIKPKQSGEYIFLSENDDGIRVYIDEKVVIDDWTNHDSKTNKYFAELEGGKEYKIKIEYYESSGDATLKFGWAAMQNLDDTPVKQIAAKTDAAVIVVGFGEDIESEGSDRPYELPEDQIKLINIVAASNPNTIVILSCGGSVSWDGWLDKVPALLHAWFPGQEGGTAIADIIFGKVNPSGKLPITLEKKMEDIPSSPYYFSKNGKSVQYTEGIFVGYRGYDEKKIEPLFPFGYGLSYTSFEYSTLEITPAVVKSGDKFQVKFTVKNTGACEGAETAQVYINDVECSVPRPPKELKAFEKVFLKPGESKTVILELDKSALSFYDYINYEWTAEPGMFKILAGSSSRDIRLTADLKLE